MYATKKLSVFKDNPEESSQPPPEGPSSGYLAVKENIFWGQCWRRTVRNNLPIPHNKFLEIDYNSSGRDSTYTARMLFVPVVNLPLSANRYYAIVAEGYYKGRVYTCSTEDDMVTCCFRPCIGDVEPKPFDYRDIYQQIVIIPNRGGFTAKSVAPDGFLPGIFRQKCFILYESLQEEIQLGDAFGLNNAIRSNFLKHDLATNVVAGKWYCPFIFVREGKRLKDQMKKSCYYEVALDQYWQEVYSGIENRRILLKGEEIMREEKESNGFIWFTTKTEELRGERIGLSLALWERIIWEENRQGWIDQDTDAMEEEVKLGSFVLVERFSFKRLDGSVALALDFVHTDKIRTK